MKLLRHLLMLLGLIVALGVPSSLVWHKERVIAQSEPMLLELAPVDPRSLMQGDYMILRYDIARRLETDDWPRTGRLLVTLDDNNVVVEARLDRPGDAPDRSRRFLAYRLRDGEVRLGAESFFFQEGSADAYSDARYGELRVDEAGEAVLVGLRGPEREILGPPGDHPLQ